MSSPKQPNLGATAFTGGNAFMLIRFTCRRVTPTRAYECGREYDLPETEARQWIANGVADLVQAQEKAIEQPVKNKMVRAPRQKKSE